MKSYLYEKRYIVIACLAGLLSAFGALGYFWGAEIVIATASVFIAGCALVATIWQGLATREHNKLSVLPLLRLEASDYPIENATNNEREYKLVLVNHGIGPAIIKDFVLFSDGKKVFPNNSDNYDRVLKEALKQFSKVKTFYCEVDGVIAVGEIEAMWQFEYKFKQNTDITGKFGVRIEYNSIYGQKMPPCEVINIPKIGLRGT